MSGAQEKTEKPTGKKLSDARKRGKVVKSTELNAVAVLLVGGFAIVASSGLIYEHFNQMLEGLWSEGFHIAAGGTPDSSIFVQTMSHFFIMLSPTVLAILVMAIVINIVQTQGLMFSTESIRMDFTKLNPLTGLKRFVSTRTLVELVKSVFKLLIVSYVVYAVFLSDQDLLLSLSGKELPEVVEVIGHLVLKIVYRVGGIMLAVSLLDYLYQRWQFNKDLMMSKQEMKEEHKQSEGNPQIKARIRSLQRAMARQRMMNNVPKASGVITNPTHYAVAVLYTPEMEAPRVVAKGMNFVALTIIKIARQHHVPVIQNPPLARALYKQVKLDTTIPATLYKAVAKVLAYIYQQKKRRPG